jgi:hypothetical protein
MIDGISAAGFNDQSLWEQTEKEGDKAVRKLIDETLNSTSVTVVLIGAQTASLEYVSYEIEQSVARGKGLFGVRIHTIKDRDGRTESPGPVPSALARANTPIYMWEYGKLGEWVEKAFQAAHTP